MWAKFAYTASDGKDYQVDYYNLDVIISVGYRVKSLRDTQFRIWASNILKEYMKKGFALNDDLLKNNGGGIYFDELLERIRDIRCCFLRRCKTKCIGLHMVKLLHWWVVANKKAIMGEITI